MMKGLDAAIWTVCEAFGLQKVVVPVYHNDDKEDDFTPRRKSPPSKKWDPFAIFNRSSNSNGHLNPDGRFNWIGKGFNPFLRGDYYMGDYEDYLSKRLSEAGFLSQYRGIYWLNTRNQTEASVAFTTVNLPIWPEKF